METPTTTRCTPGEALTYGILPLLEKTVCVVQFRLLSKPWASPLPFGTKTLSENQTPLRTKSEPSSRNSENSLRVKRERSSYVPCGTRSQKMVFVTSSMKAPRSSATTCSQSLAGAAPSSLRKKTGSPRVIVP